MGHVDRLFELDVRPVQRHRREGVAALLAAERGVVDPRDETLRREAVRGVDVVRREGSREPREREADGHPLGDLVRDAPVAHDEDHLALTCGLRRRCRGRAGKVLQARRAVRAAREQQAHRVAQRLEAGEGKRLVVPAQGVVGLIALLEGQPREKAPEAEH